MKGDHLVGGDSNERKENSKMDAPPKDDLDMMYYLFLFYGVASILPWDFYVAESDYWNYKLRTVNQTSNETEHHSEIFNNRQIGFGPLMSIFSLVPQLATTVLNAIIGHRFRSNWRIEMGFLVIICVFVLDTALVKVNTDSWQDAFQYITLGSAVLLNIGGGVLAGSASGFAANFPSYCLAGYFTGRGLGGIIPSCSTVISIFTSHHPTNQAFLAFCVTNTIVIGSLIYHFTLVNKSKCYKFYADQSDASLISSQQLLGNEKVSIGEVLRTISGYAWAETNIFVTTYSIWPAICRTVVSANPQQQPWADDFFWPVITVLYGLADFLGRKVAEVIQWPKTGPRSGSIMVLISIARVILVPLILICNLSPGHRHLTPIKIKSDTVYTALVVTLAVTHGYFGSICLISAPQICKPHQRTTAAASIVAFTTLGMGLGSLMSGMVIYVL